MINIKKINLNNLILIFLTVQIFSVSFSIALSSIAFGIWGGLWIISLFTGRENREEFWILKYFNPVNFFILLYILFEIISRIFAIYPDGAVMGLKRMFLFLIFYVSILKFDSLESLLRSFLIILVINAGISIYEISVFIPQFLREAPQIGVSEVRLREFSYPLTSGQIKMMLFLAAFPLLFAVDFKFFKRKYVALLLIPIFISMLITQSRNVYLALFICLLLFGIFYSWRFLVFYLVIIILAGLLLPKEFLDRTKSIVDPNHPSNEIRITMWNTGIKMFLDRPFTGVGDNKIMEIYETYREPTIAAESSHLHSNIMMILVTTGIFGFISYLGFMISLLISNLRFMRRQKDLVLKTLTWGSIMVLIGFNIAGLTEWSFGDQEVVTVFFFLISFPFILNKLIVNNNYRFTSQN